MRVSAQQKQAARLADLHAWVLKNAPDRFERVGDSLRFKENHSISIRRGYCGYTDFGETDEKGNSIDFLMKYLGYSFQGAVLSLLNEVPSAANFEQKMTPRELRKNEEENPAPPIQLPAKSDNQRRLFGYLCKTRGIPATVVQQLFDQELIYQEATFGNIVFHSAPENWAEVRGTLTDKPYHGILTGSARFGCWRFNVGDPKTVYITESAIDAVSLACINGNAAQYVSIGGAAKQGTIDRIKKEDLPVVIATDADAAGDATAQNNKDCSRLRPENGAKDWNEVLLQGVPLFDVQISK